jgi:predicted ATPase
VERTESVSSQEGPYAPTEKQVAYFQRLVASPVFSEEEKERSLDWLANKATKNTIKDQIDWLKRQVETRNQSRAEGSAE